MTVLTGESGAGKSKIIDSIAYLNGKRASQDDIRHGESRAVIEGVFDFPEYVPLNETLEDIGIERDEFYILRREIMNNGKSLIKMNNQIITLSPITDIMHHAFSSHSQSR